MFINIFDDLPENIVKLINKIEDIVSEDSLQPGGVVVNHARPWTSQPRFESVPGYMT